MTAQFAPARAVPAQPTTGSAAASTGAPAGDAADQRASWLIWRRGGLGGSDVAALVGLSPWESPWSIFADKCGLVSRDMGDDVPDHIDFGRRAEPMLAQWFHDKTGLYVAGEQTWCSNPAEPWMRCTVDGFVFDGNVDDDLQRFDVVLGQASIDTALGVFEIKTSGDAPWDEVPPHYQCQAQWSMAVTGMPMCWFGVLHLAFGRPKFRVYELARDEADIALLTNRGRTFWHEHVLTGTPPPTDAHSATTDALNAAWEPDPAECVEADDDLMVHVTEYHKLKAAIARLEDTLAASSNAIRAALGEATTLTHGGDGRGKPVVAATWKLQERDGYFVKPTSFRKLDIKKPKGATHE